jgi:hypothetical protein
MKGPHPPRLALALLERVVPDSAPLAGDLLEEFERHPSRAWLWWQVLSAIAATAYTRPDEIRPLRLVDIQPADAQERSRRRSVRFRPINLTASPLPGIGGLSIVVLALLVTLVAPGAWLLLFAAMLAGIALGVAMIAMQRNRIP